MPFQIPITGRLIDGLGSGVSGAQVWLTAKATSRGVENVAKTQDGYFATDSNGYYSTSLASGQYKIDYLAPGALDVEPLGIATVSGVETLDLGTLIGNSIPPPSQLQDISDVNVSGRHDGSALVWNAASQRWRATGGFVPSGSQRVISTSITNGSSGVWVAFNPFFPTAPKVTMAATFTGDSQWLVYPRAVTTSGVSGHFGGIVTQAGGTLYTYASL